ncbi:MAG: DUF1275 domain-containing protein [Bdellovibrionales bacterium]|nr:DUF1275 domain-containing protein [Oligoflexia bacterium]
MFVHQPATADKKGVIAHWFLLSFNGGIINAGGFLATGRFVSHVTGFATLFGVDMANYRFDIALGALTVPLFFLFGAFIAGFLIDRPIYRKRVPHFDWVMGLSAFCLFMAAFAGKLEQFETFGGSNHLKKIYVLLALLCMACGLQNGAITSSSGSTVRSTHLTGLTTDLGLGLARLTSYQAADRRFRKETRANWLRAGSITSFALGSIVGAALFLKVAYLGFLLPALIATYAAWHGYKAKVSAHKQIMIED